MKSYGGVGSNSPFLSPPSSSSSSRISSTLLFIIVILAVIFFIAGFLHLLARFLIKRRSNSLPVTRSNREMSAPDSVQRQLQQLFHLHDSGLDQEFIDSLPVFLHKEIIMGLKESFDCAVCLCEFSEQDKLRLLPLCSHAFHVDCIDTWLLSNSTCPLCRGTLFAPDFSFQKNPCFDFDDSREEDGDLSNGAEAEIASEKRVFSVRLGKFRNTNVGYNNRSGEGETSSSSSSRSVVDARRCYSMGSFQYVLQNSELQVILRPNRAAGESMRLLGIGKNVNLAVDGGVGGEGEGKKINSRSKGDSFSVSKIWLWSKKSKFQSSSSDNPIIPPPVNFSLP